MRKIGIWLTVGILLTALSFGAYCYLNTKPPKGIEVKEEGVETKVEEIEDEVDFINVKAIRKEKEVKNNSSVKLSDIRSGENMKPDFAELPKKEFQYFTIDPTKENTITGKEGTVITFKANSFNTKSTKLVKIKLKEYFKLSDITFSNLTTQTKDGQLIETGGMVLLQAGNSSNSNLELVQGKSIELKFPTKNKKKGMQTFLGEENSKGNVVWKAENKLKNVDSAIEVFDQPEEVFEEPQVFTIVENMPVFKGCETENTGYNCTTEKTNDFIKNFIKIPSGVLKSEINGRCFLQFFVNEVGQVEGVKIIRSLNPVLDELALDAVYNLPQFTPGTQRGRPVKVQFTIPVSFNVDGGDNFSEEAYSQFMKESSSKAEKRKQELLNRVIPDSLVTSVNKQVQQQLNLDNYILSSNKLGWINCDRFITTAMNRVTFSINERNRSANISMIFKSMSSIIRANVGIGRHFFVGIPKEEMVLVFGSKNIDNKLYIAIENFKTKNCKVTLNYKLATKELIATYASLIDKRNDEQLN